MAPVPRNVKFINNFTKPPGYAEPKIFPKGSAFNEDNYGPIVVPRKGDVIPLTPEIFYAWEIFIRREGHSAAMRNGVITIDGAEAKSYTVGRDYVFGMGDNRDNSLDGRFWGFIPEEAVVGTPLIVYWSWDPDLPLFDLKDKFASIRLTRIGTLVR
jgi:signal peptidase I